MRSSPLQPERQEEASSSDHLVQPKGAPHCGLTMSSGSLLRLFQSEFFDSHLHMHYLLTMEQSGVQDYLVNQLYKMTDDDIDFYLPQLCQIALLRYKNSLLHRFLLDKAAHSMHFALKIYWLVQSVAEDRTPELCESALAMVNACETALVNSDGLSPAGPGRKLPLRRSSSGDVDHSTEDDDIPMRRRSSSVPADLDRSATSNDSIQNALSSMDALIGLDASAQPSDGSPAAGQLRRSCTPPARTRFAPPLRRPNATDDGPADVSLQSDNLDDLAICTSPSSSSRQTAFRQLVAVAQQFPADAKAQAFGLQGSMPNAYMELGEPVKGWAGSGSDEAGVDSEMRQFMLKQRRCDYFNTQSHLVSMITKLSTALTLVQDKTERVSSLTSVCNVMNRWLLDRRVFMAMNIEGPLSLLGLHIPILRKRDTRQQVLRLHPDMCRIFSSATRAPFMFVWETANLDEVLEDAEAPKITAEAECDNAPKPASCNRVAEAANADSANTAHTDQDLLKPDVLDPLAKIIAQELGAKDLATDASESSKEMLWRYFRDVTPEQWQSLRCEVAPMTPAEPKPAERCARCRAALTSQKTEDPKASSGKVESPIPDPKAAASSCPACRRIEQAVQARHLIWGESWQDRVERARRDSPYGHYSSWTLDAVVVKGADDLRQELLAAQVVRVFIEIFKEARLPLWLKETEVLVTSSNSGLLEFIYDSSSIDSMKKRFPGKSLAEIFKVAFADKLFEAKQNFIESCAAYSLLVWFLQVKDRHNGNLMILSSGHVIHIDFGFMLSNSPGGNFGFESSPFKLTQEFLDVMDGECSDQYEYFRTLVIRGFLEARKHMERIILPIRMMLDGSKMPCFREGADWVLQSLHDRFFVNLTEEACIEKIVDLIDASVNNWRTIQYDTYQRIVNGIL